mmetsp:Transcript_73456/g.192636  ORF Transcript_73456/g.192636 Transcript_73456/m.192636 type:complete len:228 (-) Transcript_73456:336-1019(-)
MRRGLQLQGFVACRCVLDQLLHSLELGLAYVCRGGRVRGGALLELVSAGDCVMGRLLGRVLRAPASGLSIVVERVGLVGQRLLVCVPCLVKCTKSFVEAIRRLAHAAHHSVGLDHRVVGVAASRSHCFGRAVADGPQALAGQVGERLVHFPGVGKRVAGLLQIRRAARQLVRGRGELGGLGGVLLEPREVGFELVVALRQALLGCFPNPLRQHRLGAQLFGRLLQDL